MIEGNDNLLKSLVPYLEEYLKNLRTQKDEIDIKIREVEQKLAKIGHDNVLAPLGQPRRPRGANNILLQTWFKEHPTETVGQAEVAAKTGIKSSSARAVLDTLTKRGVLERDGSLWRLKQPTITEQE